MRIRRKWTVEVVLEVDDSPEGLADLENRLDDWKFVQDAMSGALDDVLDVIAGSTAVEIIDKG